MRKNFLFRLIRGFKIDLIIAHRIVLSLFFHSLMDGKKSKNILSCWQKGTGTQKHSEKWRTINHLILIGNFIRVGRFLDVLRIHEFLISSSRFLHLKALFSFLRRSVWVESLFAIYNSNEKPNWVLRANDGAISLATLDLSFWFPRTSTANFNKLAR